MSAKLKCSPVVAETTKAAAVEPTAPAAEVTLSPEQHINLIDNILNNPAVLSQTKSQYAEYFKSFDFGPTGETINKNTTKVTKFAFRS